MKISKTKTDNQGSFIAKSKSEAYSRVDKKIKFSFNYLQTNSKFNLNDCGAEYLFLLVSRLKQVSNMTVDDFRKITFNTIRNHEIDWDNSKCTENSFGIPEEDEKGYEPWQFGLDNNKNGRIHGFFIGNIFYIRWFDPKHRLYELEENKNDPKLDKNYRDIIKEKLESNGIDWAVKHLEILENEVDESEKLNDALCDDIEKLEEKMESIKLQLCEDCKEELLN